MRSDIVHLVLTRRTQLAAVVTALLFSLLPRIALAAAIETVEQFPGTACASVHTVAAGETLSRIAESAGVSLSALSQANNITNPDNVYVGQELCIPHAATISAQAAPSTPTTSQPTGTAAAWTGKYYSGQELSGDPLLTRQDQAINFNWASGSPGVSIPNDSFSASWTATVDFEAGAYRFSALADDGVRIYVGGTLLLEDWNIHPASTTVSDIELTEGSHTIRVEYFEAGGMASISVWWEKKQQADPPDCETQPHDSLSRSWSHAALGCPTAAGRTVWGAWQPFERGHMIWRQDDDALFVYANDGNWARFDDDWEDQPLSNNRGAPPTGLQSPVRGFGYLWETDDEVFAELGWATAAEKGFCILIQQFEKGVLLIGDPVESCFGDAHNFVVDTPFANTALQALDSGAWELVCQIQTHGRLRPFWRQSELGCPLATGQVLWSAWQPFQSGHMIWRQDDDAVFVFTSEGEWTRFSDDWDEQTLTGTRGAPPTGLHSPVRGFGYLWETNDGVFADLGWATDQEKGFCALVQKFEKGALLIGDLVDSCFTDTVNLAAQTPFALNALRALNNATWEIACRLPTHEKLHSLWDQTELGCPLAAGGILWAAWQPFQTGHMIWRQDSNAIFVFVAQQGWNRFANDWNDQALTGVRGAPPQGLQTPVRGFGYLWETDDDVFADVGWATAEERGFCAVFQPYEQGFLLLSDPVPSCYKEIHNEATEIDFALHSLRALDTGSWTLR